MAKETIALGGGCFWCTEAVFKMVPGVVGLKSGYAGGTTENPTYETVSNGNTGHAEVVKIEFDNAKVKLPHLLDIFFKMHDPTSRDRQGNDVGHQYRSLILYTTEAQKKAAVKYLEALGKKYEKPITTELAPLAKFYPAEDYHQDYFKKNPHQPYCIFVVAPKVAKIKKEFKL